MPIYGEGSGNPLQYSCLENPMDGGTWWATVHGVAKSQTRLSDFTFTFHFHALEKEMTIHSSILAWRIPGAEEPGGLPSIRSPRVRHNWSDLAAAAAACLYNHIYFEVGNGTPLHYSCLENSMDRDPGGLQSIKSQRVRHDWAHMHDIYNIYT